MQNIFSFPPAKRATPRLALAFCCVSLMVLTSCASGATTSIGGGAGSRGGGGGIAISFPVGDSSSSSQPVNQPVNQPEPQSAPQSAPASNSQQTSGQVNPINEEQAALSGLSQNTEQAGQANTSTYLGSNLYSPYPKPNCYEPMKPDRDDSAGSYMLYKQQLDKYRICVDTYVKNAKNDMQDIEAKANSALRQYRLFVTRP